MCSGEKMSKVCWEIAASRTLHLLLRSYAYSIHKSQKFKTSGLRFPNYRYEKAILPFFLKDLSDIKPNTAIEIDPKHIKLKIKIDFWSEYKFQKPI